MVLNKPSQIDDIRKIVDNRRSTWQSFASTLLKLTSVKDNYGLTTFSFHSSAVHFNLSILSGRRYFIVFSDCNSYI
ncbi:hypothetical protein BANRA_05400 [Escherichia coli]|nr:hypothetical protein BANRA_05400 [Escherichia coli]